MTTEATAEISVPSTEQPEKNAEMTASLKLILDDYCLTLQRKLNQVFPDWEVHSSFSRYNYSKRSEVAISRRETTIRERKRFLRSPLPEKQQEDFPLVGIAIFSESSSIGIEFYDIPNNQKAIAIHIYDRSFLVACASELAQLKERWSPFLDKYFNPKLMEK